ncbi:E3 ubiquitin-protein ligase synoviolin [Nematocida minor]|uniref:E3 ubiquitin-protein ligase synoviolin n=1 Tax=Nematocida minor TaxID=1912983 RepID=UPI00221E853A|nr:E3 ubiquitin-protein ligase synoviolin [Nematocida minor]KAI5189622.1 E3 ubiquitin-protein ligase synoviolin [Nematocida minor]
MSMYRHETYLAIYMTVLGSICVNDYIKGRSLYGCLVGMAEKRLHHFLLSLFFIGSLYVIGKGVVSLTIGTLSPLDKEGVQENAMRYLGNICLVVTLFADNITIRCLVLFAFVFGLKVLHWLIGFRIDALEKSGASCTQMERVVLLTVSLFVLDGALAYHFIATALEAPGVSILFAFEFFTLFAYTVRSLYTLSVLYLVASSGIEDRIFLVFYGDFLFCVVKILAHIVCLVWTTMNFKMPINLLRECIIAIKHLIVKTKSMLAYKSLISFLDRCADVPGEQLGSDKTCLICHEDMAMGKRLECSHTFHFVCLKEWLHRQQACPVCRKEVASKKEEQPASSSRETQTAPTDISSVVRVLFNGQNDEYEGVPVTIASEQP